VRDDQTRDGGPRGEPTSTGDGADRRVAEESEREVREAPTLFAFDDRVGSTFTVRRPGEDDVEVRLADLDVRSDGSDDDWQSFSLYFDGPDGDGEGMRSLLSQGLYRLEHPRLDPFDVNLVPTVTEGPDPEDVRYEAAFNRHVPSREPDGPLARLAGSSSRRGFLAKAVGVAAGIGLLSGGLGEPVGRAAAASSEPYLGSIEMVGFTFAPRGWADCDGQLLAISQNTALYSLLGTTYGGDGRTTFGLPDMRGRVPMGRGRGPGLTPRRMGETGGAESVALTANELPSHAHTASATSSLTLPVSSDDGDVRSPVGNALAAQGTSRGTTPASPVYTSGGTDGSMALAGGVDVTTGTAGGGQAHTNVQPYVVVRYVIALQGLFPSRS